MNGPHCRLGETKVLAKKTDLGYALFRCRECRRTFTSGREPSSIF
jgi:transposase-like protein